MPLVEFTCPTCGRRIEELVRSTSEAAPPACPDCGGAMRRALSAFNAPGGSVGGGGGCAGHNHGSGGFG